MSRIFVVLSSLLAVFFFATVVQGSSANWPVELASRIEINLGNDVKAIKREVSAGTQIWNFAGEHAGYFVDEKGKKIESLNYSNYQSAQNSTLVINKFGQADVGRYQKDPNPPIVKNGSDGSFSQVLGPELEIFIKTDQI